MPINHLGRLGLYVELRGAEDSIAFASLLVDKTIISIASPILINIFDLICTVGGCTTSSIEGVYIVGVIFVVFQDGYILFVGVTVLTVIVKVCVFCCHI